MQLPRRLVSGAPAPLAAILGVSVAAFLVFSDLHVHAAGERTDVPVVKDGGNADPYQQFRSRLGDWIKNITDEFPSPMKETEYLQRLRVFEQADFPTRADLAKFWKKGDALEIFSPVVVQESPGHYYVESRVYLGELQGNLASSSLVIKEPYTVRDYADTKDSHLAVLFYGLAMDAKRVDPSRRALIAQFLGVAKGKLRDIRKRKQAGKLAPDLAALEEAIASSEKNLVARK